MNTTEELLGRKSSRYGLENREYFRRDPQKLTLTSPAGDARSVVVVRSRTKTKEFYLSKPGTLLTNNDGTFLLIPDFILLRPYYRIAIVFSTQRSEYKYLAEWTHVLLCIVVFVLRSCLI
jgi:hypothetical protein